MGFINANNIISSKLFGYKEGVSCTDAVISLNDLLSSHRANNKIVLPLFLDLS